MEPWLTDFTIHTPKYYAMLWTTGDEGMGQAEAVECSLGLGVGVKTLIWSFY